MIILSKKNILIIVDKYLPYPSSNGACVANLVESFRDNNINVAILSIYGENDYENINGTDVYSMKAIKTNVRLLEKVFHFLEDKELVDKIIKKGCELQKIYSFNEIVGVYRPIESIVAVNSLSNLLKINCSYLFFDIPLVNSMKKYKSYILQKNYIRLYKKLINNGNFIALKYYKKYFSNCLRKETENKIIYIGTPNFMPVKTEPLKNDDTINLVYAGSFYADIRNPRKMLDALKFIAGTNIYFHLYSWGCEDIVKEYKNIYGDNLAIHGRVSSEDVEKALAGANVLVNLSNTSENQVPGKVMEYFSYGKPVLNFKFIANDPGNEDYEAYPIIYNVELYKNYSSKQCLDFIKNNNNNRVPVSILSKLYIESTPEYLSNIILEG